MHRVSVRVEETIRIRVVGKDGKVKVDKKIKGNSPTQQFYDDLYREMTNDSDTTILEKLTTLAIMSEYGEEEVYVNLDSSNTTVSGSTVMVNASATWTGNGNITGVRLKTSSGVYFDTGGLNISAGAGDTVYITWTLRLLGFNFTASGSISNITATMGTILYEIASRLGTGTGYLLRIKKAKFYSGGSLMLEKNTTNYPDEKKIVVEGNPSISGELTKIELWYGTGDNMDIAFIFTVQNPVNIRTIDIIHFELRLG